MDGRLTNSITFAILTVSDRCFAGQTQDKSGPELRSKIEDRSLFSHSVVLGSALVPDDIDSIKKAVVGFCNDSVNVVLTTGGTGLSPRDLTPEAVAPLLDRRVQGMESLLLSEGLKKTPYSAISRTVVGVRNKTLVVTLPGSVKGALEGLEALAPILAHVVDLILDRKAVVALTHGETNHLLGAHGSTNGVQCQNRKSKVTVNVSESSRVRVSRYPMLDMGDIPNILQQKVSPLESEKLHSKFSVGRILAEDVLSSVNLPPVRTSMMDGYAVIDSTALNNPNNKFTVAAESTPGKPFQHASECGHYVVKVSTGSAVPDGTTYVIPVEETKSIGESLITITEISNRVESRVSHIREVGSDMHIGRMVMCAGALVAEPELGVLAAAGKMECLFIRKPVVGVLSTGDELRGPWEDLGPHNVKDTNKVVLLSLLESWGYTVIDLGIAKDKPDDVLSLLSKGFTEADVVITTGGMSMGERDLLKDVLIQDFDATIHFGRLAMKPGKPTGFATLTVNNSPKYWFGLPGNPASSYVTVHLVVLPALRRLAGWTSDLFLPKTLAALSNDVQQDKERPEYQRALISYATAGGDLLPTPLVTTEGRSQRSSSISGCARANCLIEVPRGSGVLPAGSMVTVHLI